MNTATTTTEQTISARLIFDVSYLPNGVSMETLTEMLQQVAARAIEEGMVTGHTDAEVADYTISVVELPEPLSEEVLTSLMAQRIEDGQLALEDIPNRLAKFGLMEPHSFVSEMHERLQTAEG